MGGASGGGGSGAGQNAAAAGGAKGGKGGGKGGKGSPKKARGPKRVKISKKKNPEAYDHAKSTGKPKGPFTVDRKGKSARRAANLKGKKPVPGKDRDEWPPAFTKEGEGASVRAIDRGQNRSVGAILGNETRELPEGGKFIVDWVD